MKIQKLHIEQQMARISVHSRMAAISIRAPRRKMKISYQDARMTAKSQPPGVKLDMRAFRNHNGIKDISAFLKENTAKAYAQAARGIRELVADGNYIGVLPGEGNRIGMLAKSRLLETREPEAGGGPVPYGPVKMEGYAGRLTVNWSKHDLKIEWDEFQVPQITVQPKASVHIDMVREPQIAVTVVEESIPPEKGGAIDAKA